MNRSSRVSFILTILAVALFQHESDVAQLFSHSNQLSFPGTHIYVELIAAKSVK